MEWKLRALNSDSLLCFTPLHMWVQLILLLTVRPATQKASFPTGLQFLFYLHLLLAPRTAVLALLWKRLAKTCYNFIVVFDEQYINPSILALKYFLCSFGSLHFNISFKTFSPCMRVFGFFVMAFKRQSPSSFSWLWDCIDQECPVYTSANLEN